MNGEPVVARPPSAGYRLRKAIRRNKLIVTSGTAIVLALVTGLALNTRQLIRVTRLKLELGNQVREAKTARAEAEAIAAFLVDALTRSLPSRDGRFVRVEETLDRVAYRLNHESPGQFSDWPRFQNAVAEVYRAYGAHDKAIPLLEKVHQHFSATLDPDDPEMLAVKNRLADSFSAVKRPDEALRLREEVLERTLQDGTSDRPEVLIAMGHLAVALEQAGEWDRAIELRQTLVDRHRETDGMNHLQTLIALRRLGDSYEAAGRGDEAIRTWDELLPLLHTVLGPGARETLQTSARLAAAYTTRGWCAQALELRFEILESNLNNRGPGRTETVDAVYEFVKACEACGHHAEAQQLRQGVVAAMEGSWPQGANHPLRILVTRTGQRLGIVTPTR